MVRGVLVNDEAQYIYFISIPFADLLFFFLAGLLVYWRQCVLSTVVVSLYRLQSMHIQIPRTTRHASFYRIMQLVPTYPYNRPCAQRLPTSYEIALDSMTKFNDYTPCLPTYITSTIYKSANPSFSKNIINIQANYRQ